MFWQQLRIWEHSVALEKTCIIVFFLRWGFISVKIQRRLFLLGPPFGCLKDMSPSSSLRQHF